MLKKYLKPGRPEGFLPKRGLSFCLGLSLSLLLALFLLTPLAQAQGKGTVLTEEKIEKIESIERKDFVYIFCNPLDDLRVKKLTQGAKATAKKFNVPLKLFGPETPYDADAVHEILRRVVTKSPAGIAMEIGHPSKFDETIGKAVDSGIYFISFSMDDWTANPRQGYVGYNWREEGKTLANELFKEFPPKSKILLLDSESKQGRSCHARIKGITGRLNAYNFDYTILTVKAEKDAVEKALLDYIKKNEVDGIVSLWGEITRHLARITAYEKLHSIRTGGFGCGDFEKFVRSGSLDVLMKVVTQLEGGIPLENLHYSALYGVTPSSVQLHAKPVTQ